MALLNSLNLSIDTSQTNHMRDGKGTSDCKRFGAFSPSPVLCRLLTSELIHSRKDRMFFLFSFCAVLDTYRELLMWVELDWSV